MMKKFTILTSFLAIAMMASCSKYSDGGASDNPNDQLNGAYLKLSISSPQTRADLPDEPGTSEESTVAKVKLLIFDKDYNFISSSESAVASKANTFNFEVAPDAYRFFAIANPTAAINEALKDVSGNWNTVSSKLQTILSLDSKDELSAYITDDAFTMVNAGSYESNVESVLVKPLDGALTDGKLSIDPDKPTPISIKVDRMVAKFRANLSDTFVVKDKRTEEGVAQSPAPIGEIKGVRLNVTNKKSYIYSHIKQVNLVGDDYRGDPNMGVVGEPAKPRDEKTALTENFFWLHNYDNPVFNALGDASNEYVFENTANGTSYNYNNLTQLVVKAKYVPTGMSDPDDLPDGFTTALDHDPADQGSWFNIDIVGVGSMQMTFTGVRQYYAEALKGNEDYAADPVTCGKMDIQLRHILASASDLNGIAGLDTVTWANPLLTCAVLNSVENGGYVAATVDKEENYIVEFYQFGLNYYDIFIQHDDDQDPGHLGRWGMVRNNWYTLSINSLTGPGLPYIPDPTDPDIKDPQNPDPEDPEPADKDMAQIKATIEVNPWTMWTQGVDLN